MSNEQSANPRLPVATVSKAGKPGGRSYKRHYSNFLLDKSLQLRYIGVVTIISAVLLGTLGTLIWKQKNDVSSQIVDAMKQQRTTGDAASDKVDDDLRKEVDAGLRRDDRNWIFRLFGVGIGLVFVLFFLLLVMTHKVAGPLYKVSLYFDRMAHGKLGETYPLRRGDMLKDFYDKFKEMHDTVRSRFQAENDVVGRFVAACDAAGIKREGALGSSLDALDEHHQARQEALS